MKILSFTFLTLFLSSSVFAQGTFSSYSLFDTVKEKSSVALQDRTNVNTFNETMGTTYGAQLAFKATERESFFLQQKFFQDIGKNGFQLRGIADEMELRFLRSGFLQQKDEGLNLDLDLRYVSYQQATKKQRGPGEAQPRIVVKRQITDLFSLESQYRYYYYLRNNQSRYSQRDLVDRQRLYGGGFYQLLESTRLGLVSYYQFDRTIAGQKDGRHSLNLEPQIRLTPGKVFSANFKAELLRFYKSDSNGKMQRNTTQSFKYPSFELELSFNIF